MSPHPLPTPDSSATRPEPAIGPAGRLRRHRRRHEASLPLRGALHALIAASRGGLRSAPEDLRRPPRRVPKLIGIGAEGQYGPQTARTVCVDSGADIARATDYRAGFT